MPINYSSALQLRQMATPAATPPASSTLLYVKSDNKLYYKDSTGTEALVGPQSGGVPDPLTLGTLNVSTINPNAAVSPVINMRGASTDGNGTITGGRTGTNPVIQVTSPTSGTSPHTSTAMVISGSAAGPGGFWFQSNGPGDGATLAWGNSSGGNQGQLNCDNGAITINGTGGITTNGGGVNFNGGAASNVGGVTLNAATNNFNSNGGNLNLAGGNININGGTISTGSSTTLFISTPNMAGTMNIASGSSISARIQTTSGNSVVFMPNSIIVGNNNYNGASPGPNNTSAFHGEQIHSWNNGIFLEDLNGGGGTTANINNAGRIVRTSTERMKKNVKPMTMEEASSVMGLESYTFQFRKTDDDLVQDPRRYPGFIAEQGAECGAELWVGRQHKVERDEETGAATDIVRDTEGEIIYFRTADITVAHNVLIKELYTEIESLVEELAELREEVTALRASK